MRAKPAYQRIKEAIVANIHAGVWQVGEVIPTELALCEQFGVSRMTVNRALKELSEERILERRQGSGTYVAQQQFNHTFVEVRNIAHDIQASGCAYHAKVICLKTVDFDNVPAAIQHKFTQPISASNLNSNISQPTNQHFYNNSQRSLSDSLFYVEIVHYSNDEPLQFEARWVDAGLVPAFIEQDFSRINSSDYLLAHVPLEGGDYTISARLADANVAANLGIEVGEPTLLLARRTLSQGRVVTVVNMWHAGSRYQFFGQL